MGRLNLLPGVAGPQSGADAAKLQRALWPRPPSRGRPSCRVRSDARRADELATAAEDVIVAHGLADMYSVLLATRGIAAVTAGRHDDAFAILRRAFEPTDKAYH